MILLLGGTSESLAVADQLTAANLPFVVSVTTDYGAELAGQHATRVVKQTLTPETVATFIKDHQIKLIIDATHPFARVISTMMITASQSLKVPYIRFERQTMREAGPDIKVVKDLDAALALLKQRQGPIYLSTGSKTAATFARELGVERLHVRVLPTAKVVANLQEAGYQANQIDAIQGPFTERLNVELFARTAAKTVVTKASGRQGGVQEKIKACQELGILCVIIERPAIAYPAVTSSISDLISRVEVLL